MKKITKKEFLTLHHGNKLKLLSGMVFESKKEMMKKIKGIKNIKEYGMKTTNHGNIYGKETTIYKDKNIILVETFISEKESYVVSYLVK